MPDRRLLTFDDEGTLLDVEISGTPRPQGSLRVITRKTGRAFAKSPEKMLDYRATLAARLAHEWHGAPCEAPVIVLVVFGFPRPAAHYLPANRRRTERALRPDAPMFPVSSNIPDTDKLQRLLGDALTLAGVLVDDRLVVGWDALKVWTDERLGFTAVEVRRLRA